jgi:hypothetical protein
VRAGHEVLHECPNSLALPLYRHIEQGNLGLSARAKKPARRRPEFINGINDL